MTVADEAYHASERPGRWARGPLELVGPATTRLARAGPAEPGRWTLQRWQEGLAVIRADRVAFAAYWQQRNERALAGTGPLWVALGDSAAQGLGARHPQDGYVGQALVHLARRTGRPWRVLNLSCSGATIPDVLQAQLPLLAALPEPPDLVTCGVGTNDLLRLPLPRMRSLSATLLAELPDNAVLLDVPLPRGRWRIGWFGVPYVTRLNRALYAAAARHGIPIAYVSRHFTPPWAGKFGPDNFHPSADGYRDWSQAVLRAIPAHAGRRTRSRPAGRQRVSITGPPNGRTREPEERRPEERSDHGAEQSDAA